MKTTKLFTATSLISLCAGLAGCGNAGAPLDAATRTRIDSTATAQIRVARAQLDSLCVVQRTTVLPKMVDSIKQRRLQEIERQLRTVPK